MADPGKPIDFIHILSYDPDFLLSDLRRVRWYECEYRRLSYTCFYAGIPVILGTRNFYQS